jgi:hypothetical protein
MNLSRKTLSTLTATVADEWPARQNRKWQLDEPRVRMKNMYSDSDPLHGSNRRGVDDIGR